MQGMMMTNSPNLNTPTLIPVRSPADLLAVMPYLIGFHPSASLCIVSVKASAPSGSCMVVRYDLPAVDRVEEFSSDVTSLIAGREIEVVMLVGYGPETQVTPAMNAARQDLATAGVRVAEALRADQGRYWSYTCGDDTCCPSDGTPYDISTSAAAAAAVTAGLTAVTDRGELAAGIACEEGAARHAVDEATRHAAEQIDEQITGSAKVGEFVLEVRQRIRDALEIYRNGGRLGVEDVARLSVLVGSTRLRDEMAAVIEPATLQAHLTLWTDLTRRAAINTAACASLLALTAWLDGNGALANVALDRALAADPGYTLALLIAQLLATGLPPSTAGTLPSSEDLAAPDLAGEQEESAGRS
jgi:hypothetical protein